MLPNGWKEVMLKSILAGAIKNGYSPVPVNTITGKWVLSLGALTPHGLDITKIKPVSIDDAKINGSILNSGDFIISRSNTPEKVGESALYRGEIDNCSYPDLMMRFRVNNTLAHNEYIEYVLRDRRAKTYIANCAAGTSKSMVKITKGSLEKLHILLPPISEQKIIADTLSTWDKAIEKLSQLIEEKREQKKGLMQQLLTGKQRLSGFEESEWKETKLGKLLKYEQPTKYLVKTKAYNDDYKIPVLTANKSFILGYTDETEGIYNHLPAIIFDDFTTANKFVDFQFKVKSSAIKILTPTSENVSLYFLYSLMQLIHFPLTDHQRYWISEYQHLKLHLPEYEEQNRIAAILSAADKEINQLEQKLEFYKEQKKGLMQQLLTGKKRVNLKNKEAA